MKEGTREQFKEIYFKLGGGAETGWGLEYWNESFEGEKIPGMKYLMEEPATPEHTRMMIVTDYGLNEHRLFFLTEESEESLFDFPDESQDKARQRALTDCLDRPADYQQNLQSKKPRTCLFSPADRVSGYFGPLSSRL
jgi:hypothetical protein